MKINSRFSDYYDGCLYMCGEDLFFERNTDCKEIVQFYNGSGYATPEYILQLKKDAIKISSKYLHNEISYGEEIIQSNTTKRLSFALVIIGEKVIPLFEIMFWNPGKGWISEYHYKLDGLLFNKYNAYQLKYCEDHLKSNHIDLYNKIRKLTDIPILYITTKSFILNPKLKDFNVQECVQSHEVIQELELFLNKTKQTIELKVNDKIKLQRNGFDKKSFKK